MLGNQVPGIEGAGLQFFGQFGVVLKQMPVGK